jgi:predicted nucleic acid-binding protein
MATFLLDTSVIIDVLNNKQGRKELLLQLLNEGHLLACCPINITEVYAGMKPKEETATEGFLRSLDLYPIDWPVAKLAGELKRDFARKGKTLNLGDVMIAAVALHHGLNLLTDNSKDFPMKDLRMHPLPKR